MRTGVGYVYYLYTVSILVALPVTLNKRTSSSRSIYTSIYY